MPSVTTAMRTDVGRTRDHNEDTAALERLPDGKWALVVCDGMGGHAAGEVASEVAVDRIVEVLREESEEPVPARIRRALEEANRAVIAKGEETGQPSMGTTGVIAVVDPGSGACWAGWVGDSRAAIYRDGRELRRSVDHTRVQMMVQHGILTPEAAASHPDSGVLMQALGAGPDAQARFAPEVWEEPTPLQPGDAVLVTSDGLHGPVATEAILKILAAPSVDAAAQRLIDAANEAGGPDNISVVLLFCGERVGWGLPDPLPVPAPPTLSTPVRTTPPARWRPPLTLVIAAIALAFLAGAATCWLARAPAPAPAPTPIPHRSR